MPRVEDTCGHTSRESDLVAHVDPMALCWRIFLPGRPGSSPGWLTTPAAGTGIPSVLNIQET